MRLAVAPLGEGRIEFTSQLLKAEKRDPVSLLKASSRTEEVLTICSFCKKVAVDRTEWIEIEDALAKLKLFNKDRMPSITHGICPECHNRVMEKLGGAGKQ
jgi:hypothetical protein